MFSTELPSTFAAYPGTASLCVFRAAPSKMLPCRGAASGALRASSHGGLHGTSNSAALVEGSGEDKSKEGENGIRAERGEATGGGRAHREADDRTDEGGGRRVPPPRA
jgi:hypothetical protein